MYSRSFLRNFSFIVTLLSSVVIILPLLFPYPLQSGLYLCLRNGDEPYTVGWGWVSVRPWMFNKKKKKKKIPVNKASTLFIGNSNTRVFMYVCILICKSVCCWSDFMKCLLADGTL